MNLKNLFHINSENLAVPEIHSDSFEEKQKKADAEENEELEKKDEKKDIVYDNVAIPEIHLHRKKKKK